MLEIRLECEQIGFGENVFFDLHDHDLLLSYGINANTPLYRSAL
jgi:hypothetical protein